MGWREVLCIGLLTASFTTHQKAAADETAQLSSANRFLSGQEGTAASSAIKMRPTGTQHPKRASFKLENSSLAAKQLADWVVDSGDNRTLPFVIVDKTNAKVFVFHADGQLRGASPALLGLALGDDSVPGIGNRKMSSIRPEERTTPAGRFVAALDSSLRGKDILWVDYDAAISLHRVHTNIPGEHRLQRLATPSPLDNRISYGCINVPVKFYENVVRPAFTGTDGIVYVLPETRLPRETFGSYVVEEFALVEGFVKPAQIPPQFEKVAGD